MEGHRRYAEEPEPSWYTGQRAPEMPSPYAAQAPDVSPYDSAVHERPSGAFRLPDQRSADPYSAPPAGYGVPDPVTTSGSHALSSADSGSIRIPVRGPEYPAVRPSGAAAPVDAPAVSTVTTTTTYGATPEPPPAAAYNEPTSMVPLTGAGPADAVYRSRRPVSAVVFAVVTGVLLIPAVLLLIQAAFVGDPTARGVVPAVLLTLGLPLTGFGLYSLAGGGRTSVRDAWLRPPLAYLPIGLVLLLAAGLAVA
ncbi:hypothetical protein GCM10020358_15730 [Amorphoplanes nipponensis]|uniref:Uncharacterized protein n=1 Tax=Actinoplanes nipponensis TaxID=135950 RepID=A0A919JQ38_9ACTN|nr:hypothetical protein [Actinoplanes nipponensis]GIE53337.1 hypothetical protein Ani05nite_68710 [Actinoplanes nipponensis]